MFSVKNEWNRYLIVPAVSVVIGFDFLIVTEAFLTAGAAGVVVCIHWQSPPSVINNNGRVRAALH